MSLKKKHAGAVALGKKGGAVMKKRGSEYFATIGAKGRETTKENGLNYRLMGRLGASAKRRQRIIAGLEKTKGETK